MRVVVGDDFVAMQWPAARLVADLARCGHRVRTIHVDHAAAAIARSVAIRRRIARPARGRRHTRRHVVRIDATGTGAGTATSLCVAHVAMGELRVIAIFVRQTTAAVALPVSVCEIDAGPSRRRAARRPTATLAARRWASGARLGPCDAAGGAQPAGASSHRAAALVAGAGARVRAAGVGVAGSGASGVSGRFFAVVSRAPEPGHDRQSDQRAGAPANEHPPIYARNASAGPPAPTPVTPFGMTHQMRKFALVAASIRASELFG